LYTTQRPVEHADKLENIKYVQPASTAITALGSEPLYTTQITKRPLSEQQAEKLEQQQTTPSSSVTISIIGNEPIKASSLDQQPINITVDNKKQQPIPHKYQPIIDETSIYTTTKITKSISEIHELREEIIEERNPVSGEVKNTNVLESELHSTSTYVPDNEQEQGQHQVIRHKLPIEQVEDEEDDVQARQQYAGNYPFFFSSCIFFLVLSFSNIHIYIKKNHINEIEVYHISFISYQLQKI